MRGGSEGFLGGGEGWGLHQDAGQERQRAPRQRRQAGEEEGQVGHICR